MTDLYMAVRRMRQISTAGGTFRLKFRKWNRATSRGGDMVCIEHARLRQKAGDEKIDHADDKLFLTDTDTGRALNCWLCLVMEVDGERVVLH